MFSGGYRDGNLFETNMSLRCEVKSLKRTIEEYKSGKRYLKIQKDHNRVVKGYIKEIGRLKKELSAAHAQAVAVREIWTDECDRVWQEHLSEMAKKDEKIRRLEDKVWDVRGKSDEKITALTIAYEDKLHEKDCVIDELKNKLAHAEALLNQDGTNTGTPTSQTPRNKNKVIPNSRRSSGKPKGGQAGHGKASLGEPDESEVTHVAPIHYRMMNAALRAAFQTVHPWVGWKQNTNMMSASRSLRSSTNSTITNAITAEPYSVPRSPLS